MEPAPPFPQVLFDTLVAYQRSAALAAAIELDLFTAISEGATDLPALAARCNASERGVRSLADHLVVNGFLEKKGDRYAVRADAAPFLDRRSPAYMGSIADFLHSEELRKAFGGVADAVRRGGTALGAEGVLAPDHPVWSRFARAMAPLAGGLAVKVADFLGPQGEGSPRVLDIAAGHGLYGISLARRWPKARIVFQDWPSVLQVAVANAKAAGLEGRFETLPGDAFDVDLGGPYDLILLPNVLHHFDAASGTRLLQRVAAALAPKGRVAIVEFVVDPGRVTPAHSAGFSLVMLAGTPGGDAYTRAEYETMLRGAGLSLTEIRPIPDAAQQLLLAAPAKAPK